MPLTKIVKFPSGATSTEVPRFDLAPFRALFKIMDRFALGEVRHQKGCWNARKNPQYLLDKDFVRARLNHVIKHAFLLLAKLDGNLEDDGDDDAGAIAWGGIFLLEAVEALKKFPDGKATINELQNRNQRSSAKRSK